MCIIGYHNDHIIFNSVFVPEVKFNMVDFSKGSFSKLLKMFYIVSKYTGSCNKLCLIFKMKVCP